MKNIFPSLLILVLFSCGKKEKLIPEPLEPEPVEVVNGSATNYISDLTIPGAEKIVFDSAASAYLVTLPESYTSDEINMDFKFHRGAFFTYQDHLPSPTKINFLFRNNPPMEVAVTNENGITKSFKIYVAHTAPLKAVLAAVTELQSGLDGKCSIPVDFISGIGTTPEAPGITHSLVATLKDENSAAIVYGEYRFSTLNFENVSPLFPSEDITIRLDYGAKSYVVSKKRRFSRVRSQVNWLGVTHPFFDVVPMNSKLFAGGKDFVATKKYTVKVNSDFLSSPVILDAKFENESSLSYTLPASIPNGSYSIGFYEDGELISSFTSTISSVPKHKSISQVWLNQSEYPTVASSFYKSSEIMVNRGASLFINPFPLIYGDMYKPVDTKKPLPSLQLKNSNNAQLINAITKGDPSYADGSIVLYYGQYSIPTEMPVGFYEARLIYPDKSESLPFWNKIEVK